MDQHSRPRGPQVLVMFSIKHRIWGIYDIVYIYMILFYIVYYILYIIYYILYIIYYILYIIYYILYILYYIILYYIILYYIIYYIYYTIYNNYVYIYIYNILIWPTPTCFASKIHPIHWKASLKSWWPVVPVSNPATASASGWWQSAQWQCLQWCPGGGAGWWGSWFLNDSNHWIGLRENLQETMVFTIKYRAFL